MANVVSTPNRATRIVVYDDSPVFGGHEIMSLLGVEGLLEHKVEVVFFYAQENEQLCVTLAELARKQELLEVVPLERSNRKLQPLSNHFEFRHIKALGQKFLETSPDAVVCLQGHLEISSRGVLAAKSARLPVISYIPFAHNQTEMGAKLGALRDLFSGYLLDAPDLYITISHNAAAGLRKRGTKKPIEVVYNGIDVARFNGDRVKARECFEIPQDKPTIAMCGRLETKQKGQLTLLGAIESSALLKNEVLTLMAGNGPDRQLIEAEIKQRGLSGCVHVLGWCDLATLYPALDAVVLASRFEGMPLVMLEAIVSGIPVVAPERDGMQEVLPGHWLYTPGDTSALAERLCWILQNDVSESVKDVRETVVREMSLERFRQCFADEILKFSHADRPH